MEVYGNPHQIEKNTKNLSPAACPNASPLSSKCISVWTSTMEARLLPRGWALVRALGRVGRPRSCPSPDTGKWGFQREGPRSLRWEDRVSLARETAGPPVAAPSSTAPQQEVTAEPTRASYRTRTAPQIPHQLVLRLLSRSAPDNPLVIPNDGSRFPRILCVPGPTLSI